MISTPTFRLAVVAMLAFAMTCLGAEHLPRKWTNSVGATMQATLMGVENNEVSLLLDNGHTILAYAAGKMSKFKIRVLEGDRVTVVLSPYDLTRGRVVYRHK